MKFFSMFDYEDEFEEENSVPVVRSKTAQLPYPNYNDDRFRTEQTVYGREYKGLSYEYSDRLWTWDYEKAKESADVANKAHNNKSCAWWEKFLIHYNGHEVVVEHIMATFDAATGQPVYVLGYRRK